MFATMKLLVLRAANVTIEKISNRYFSNIDLALMALSSRLTAEYIEDKMMSAKPFQKWSDMMDAALKAITIEGLFVEAGVFSGSSINYIAKRIRSQIHGFDSFEGLPEDWGSKYRKGHFTRGAKLPSVLANVTLHKGWFEQTVPAFVKDHPEPIAFLHLDCDLYSSTKVVLNSFGSQIRQGTIIVFDEYFNYAGWRFHEFKAFQEFVASNGLSYEYLAYNSRGCQVCVKIIRQH